MRFSSDLRSQSSPVDDVSVVGADDVAGALRRATGRWVALLGARTRLHPGWIATIEASADEAAGRVIRVGLVTAGDEEVDQWRTPRTPSLGVWTGIGRSSSRRSTPFTPRPRSPAPTDAYLVPLEAVLVSGLVPWPIRPFDAQQAAWIARVTQQSGLWPLPDVRVLVPASQLTAPTVVDQQVNEALDLVPTVLPAGSISRLAELRHRVVTAEAAVAGADHRAAQAEHKAAVMADQLRRLDHDGRPKQASWCGCEPSTPASVSAQSPTARVGLRRRTGDRAGQAGLAAKASSRRRAARVGARRPAATSASSWGTSLGHHRVGAEAVEQGVADLAPQPGRGLVGPGPVELAVERPTACRKRSMASHTSSMPVPGERRAGQHLGGPRAPLGAQQVHGAGVVGAGAPGRRGQVAVGLVDDDQVGQLHDPPLDALQLVAAAGGHEQGEQVDHVGDRHLGLADADGLDEHDVEPGRLAQQHGLTGAAGDTPRGGRCRGRGG